MPALAGDKVQVLVAGYDLTADSNRVSINDQRDMYDVSSFASDVHKFIPGKRNISLDHSGYFNADVAASHPVLNAGSISGVVSAIVGQNANPVVGDPAYTLTVNQGSYSASPAIGNFVPFAAKFSSKGESGGWGIALAVPIPFTNTILGSTVDNGSATSNGGSAFLHLLKAAATDRYSIKLEGSATGAFTGEQTVLGTFVANASVITSERMAFSGSIPRHVRWVATRTTGTAGDQVKIAICLVRY